MLEAIRNRLSGWVAIVILGVIALALVISFGNMDSGINPELVVAEVNGEKISVQELRQGVAAQVQRYQEQTGQDVAPFLKAQLTENVLEGIINSRVLLQYVNESGYRVSDAAVAAEIRSIPVFQVDGQFSQQTYEALLLSQGLSPQMFETDRRRALETRQLQSTVIESAFVTPADYRRFLELEAETRDIRYLTFTADSYAEGVDISAEAIAEYYAENSADFETEETVDVEFVELKLSDIAANVVVDEAQVNDYYEENIALFRTEAERRASHILISTDELSDSEALEIVTELKVRINAGDDFAVLAGEYSADPGSAAMGGDLGWSTTGVFVPEFEAALLELQQDEVSAAVKTQFGYHIIKLTDLRPGAERSLDDVRESLVAELARDEAENRFYAQSERLDDLALESLDGLGLVAEDMKIELQSVAGVGRLVGTVGLPVSEPLVNALFSTEVLEDGANTPLIEIEPGHVIVARVTKHDLPVVLPLEEVSGGIRAILVSELAAMQAAAAADAALNELRAGVDMAEVAQSNGLEVQTKNALVRGSREIAPELSNAAFSAPRPGAMVDPQLVLSPDGSVSILLVSAVTPGKPEQLSREERDARKVRLEQLVGQSQVAAVVQTLRDTANVRIFNDVLQDPEAL
jgi:peptidyl-prolyl cis-trans isomerase D